ncbi:MAG: phosphoglycolate phosphatase [Rhizobiaceae bacterium]
MTIFPDGGDRCGWPEAILFDLDGTLIDSAPDIAAAANALLAEHGRAPLPVPTVRDMIGNGVKKLVERAFAASGDPIGGAELDAAFHRMMQVYGDHLTVLTRAYPGALEAVRDFAQARVKIAVVTNKPQQFTDRILQHYGFAPFIGTAVGGEAGFAKKPEPDMLLEACRRLGVAPKRAMMVGDSTADVESARAAGMPVLLVEDGYSREPLANLGADGVMPSLSGLSQAIEALKA